MLRTIFVIIVTLLGVVYAFQGAIYTLLFYLWVAYFRPEAWVWYDWVRAINLSWIAGVATLLATLGARPVWRFNLQVGLLFAFLAQSTLSLIASAHGDYAFPYWVEFAKTITIAYVIALLVSDAPKYRLVLLTIGLSLGFEAAKQGWAGLILHPGSPNNNDLPLFGDNNGIAVGMLMLVPILTTLAATATRKGERTFFRFVALGTLYRAIATYSRGGFVACAALGFVYLLRSNRRAIAAIGIVVACAVIVPAMPDAFWDRMKTIDEASDNSSLGRLHFWNVAISMANDNPMLGVGHNAYNVSYDQYDGLHGDFGAGRSVHSIWFGVLAELGYPGLLLFIAQFLFALQAAARARAAARRDPSCANLGRYAFAIEAAVVVFAVGGAFVPLQYNEMFWHLVGLSIGLDGLAREAIEAADAASDVAAPAALTRMAVAS